MPRPFLSIPQVGDRFHNLTVIGNSSIINIHGTNHSFIEVVCKCGKLANLKISNLKTGKIKSCGCLRGSAKSMNGRSETKEYRAWCGMMKRCYDAKNKMFNRYGGRGIKVCDRWRNSLENFILDMGLCPPNKNSIDRFPNNDGNYEPNNCRWATDAEQANNRSTNKKYEIGIETKTLKEWALVYKIPYSRLWQRVKLGWDILESLNTPLIDSKFKSKNILL